MTGVYLIPKTHKLASETPFSFVWCNYRGGVDGTFVRAFNEGLHLRVE